MNLTPLVDVLLVLLVIFLAALPLTQQAFESQLPSQTQAPELTRTTGDNEVRSGRDVDSARRSATPAESQLLIS